MECTHYHISHFVTRTLILGLVTGFVLIACPDGHAQSWPVNNAEVREPVPQYSPRYPLKSPDPREQTEPVIRTTPTPEPGRLVSPDATTRITKPVPRQVDSHPDISQWGTRQPTSNTVVPAPNAASNPNGSENQSVSPTPFPFDSRKPCNCCTRPASAQPRCHCDLPGLRGRPYIGEAPGGCECNKTKPFKHPEFSVYWSRPFSAKLCGNSLHAAVRRNPSCPEKRVVDVFDRLLDFKLINYQRTDNGYCGRGADPYGYLGESKLAGGCMEGPGISDLR